MRLEPFCKITMRYVNASFHAPYWTGGFSPRPTFLEALGFGHGEGTLSGGIDGTLVWANYPRRRQDGVWTPNLRGMITATDGNELLVSVHGQSVDEVDQQRRRAILARVELTSDADAYRWLNTCFLVGEGGIDPDSEEWWLDTYVCINEQAKGPPALGETPPERFRQHAKANAAPDRSSEVRLPTRADCCNAVAIRQPGDFAEAAGARSEQERLLTGWTPAIGSAVPGRRRARTRGRA